MGRGKLTFPEIRLKSSDILRVDHRTLYTIGHEENGVWKYPEPYQKRIIRLRHRIEAEPGHIYRLNVSAEAGKEPTWYYEKDGLSFSEC